MSTTTAQPAIAIAEQRATPCTCGLACYTEPLRRRIAYEVDRPCQ
jgi:hypothetical protein